jgi:hypothetical protein
MQSSADQFEELIASAGFILFIVLTASDLNEDDFVIYSLGPVWRPAFFCRAFFGFGFPKPGFQQSRLPRVLG